MQPDLITVPFANSGLKNTIPETSANDGEASWLLGFPAICMEPLPDKGGNGIPPNGMDMNGVLYALSNAVKYAQLGVHYKFDAAVSTAIGGYPKGAVLYDDAGTSAYLSLVDNNTYNFNSQSSYIGAYWAPFAGGVIPTKVSQLTNDSGFLNTSQVNTIVANSLYPVGGLLFYPLDGNAPTGFLDCMGQAVSRTSYAKLFAVLGTTYGAGDGSTTFNLPDYRGYFLRGWGNGGGVDPDKSRAITSTQAAAYASHTHTATDSGHNHTQNAHTHTQNSHNHTQNSHNHSQNAHTHTQAAHNHGVTDNGHTHGYSVPSYGSTSVHLGTVLNYTEKTVGANTGNSKTGISIQNKTATNNNATATNNATTATNQATTATNQNTTATNQSSKANITVAASGGNETRPINRVVRILIKYQ